MRKLFHVILATNVLFVPMQSFAAPFETIDLSSREIEMFESTAIPDSFLLPPPQHVSTRDRVLYASANSVGAVAVGGLTVASGFVTGVTAALMTWPKSNDGFIAGAMLTGAAIGFTGGMAATKALGGNRIAVATGCLAGLAVTALSPKHLYYGIPVAIAVSGTIAGWDY